MQDRNNESNFTNLYVKYFDQNYVEEDLCDLFGGFGPIQSCKIMTDPRGRKSAFVNFEQHKDAVACVEAMHRKDLRPRAERKAAEKAEKAGTAPPPIIDMDGHPEHLLFVGRQQSKAERQSVLEQRYGDKGAASKGFSTSTKGSGKGKDNGNSGKGKNTEPTPFYPASYSGGGYGFSAEAHLQSAALHQDYSSYDSSRSPGCGFQQQLQAQQYQQQQPYHNAHSYGDADGWSYDATGHMHNDGSYAGNGVYGSEAQNPVNYYAWGGQANNGATMPSYRHATNLVR